MGSYDVVKIDVLGDIELQTKNLNKGLAVYRINSNGVFYLTSDSELGRPSVDCATYTNPEVLLIGFDGIKLVEYRANIKNGRCIGLEILNPEKKWIKRNVSFVKNEQSSTV